MSFVEALRRMMRSPAFKFIIIVILILALAIPLLFVYLMVNERARFASGAQAEIGRAWGGEQTLRGPFIVVPAVREKTVRIRDETRTERIRELAIFLPEELSVRPVARTEIRHRGIFSVPVYRSEIAFKGRFEPPELRKIAQPGTEMLWSEAVMALLVTDVRGIKETATLVVGSTAGAGSRDAAPAGDGAASTEIRFRSGLGVEVGATNQARPLGAIHVPVSEARARQGFEFTFRLDLNGSGAINFVPAGGETEVTVQSDWPHPSFQGAFLPDQREISDKGFEATWRIPRLARGQSQSLQVRTPVKLMSASEFGVSFFQPVQFYSLTERALKYAQGFLAIVFFAVFVLEMKSRRRVHWIQYLFVGLALVIFYLVLMGTSEHIGFEWGYALAATATSILIGSYIATVTRSPWRGGQMFAVIAVIYGLLYLLLRVEDYAMLIGSIAAFVMLAAVMFATRHVDWARETTTDDPLPPPAKT